jgi:hypothetical protein
VDHTDVIVTLLLDIPVTALHDRSIGSWKYQRNEVAHEGADFHTLGNEQPFSITQFPFMYVQSG